jgi:hypothetical protein
LAVLRAPPLRFAVLRAPPLRFVPPLRLAAPRFAVLRLLVLR